MAISESGNVRTFRAGDEDIPEFRVNDVKVRQESRRKKKQEEEAGRHHTEIRSPHGTLHLFWMDPNMKRYYGIFADISSIRMGDIVTACNKAEYGVEDVEVLVVKFKDRTLAFDLADGRVIG